MKKIASHKFSGEEEEKDIVLADHHHQPLLSNSLQVISRGRRVTLPSILEENRLAHGRQASSNRTVLDDDVGAPWISSVIAPVMMGYNPTTLRWCWCLPPTAAFNGLDIPTGDDQNNLKVDEVDDGTTLRLSNYVPRNSDVKSNLTPDLGWLRPDFFDGVEDDDVDTTLSLRPPGTTDPKKSRMQAKGKRKADADDIKKKKKASKRSKNREDDDDSRPLLPIEQIPTLMKAVRSRNGSRPIFFYRKTLAESDVRRDLNRLFVTRSRIMDFLRGEEAAAMDAGLKVVGVDCGGNVHDYLVLKKWTSVNMTIINSDWWRMVDANSAQTGDVVEIWGFRVDEKPCLAFNFRRGSCSDEGTSKI